MLLSLPATLPAQDESAAGDAAQDSNTPNSAEEEERRRPRRLGIDTDEEFSLDFTAPPIPEPALDIPDVHHPDPARDARLQELLTNQAYNPDDAAIAGELDAYLNASLVEAQQALTAGDVEGARALLAMVTSLNADLPGVAGLSGLINEQDRVDDLLTAARLAIEEDRLVSPETNSARFYLDQVLDLQPDNRAAQDQLSVLQLALVEQALLMAREDSDFEAADLLLQDAEAVLPNSPEVVDARQRIGEMQREQIDSLLAQVAADIEAEEFESAEGMLNQLIALGEAPEQVNALRQQLADARLYAGYIPGQVIDDPLQNSPYTAPPVVVVPAGSFLLGSPEDEPGRVGNEGPQHRVVFERGFAIGQREISVADFRLFVEATGYRTDAERLGNSRIYDENTGTLTRRDEISWRNNYQGRDANETDPVIHVSWSDASNYATWLSQQTGQTYRLPSEAEFEYALRAGGQTLYWWGDDAPDGRMTNTTGERDVSDSRRRWTAAFRRYDDGYWGPAPVGSFQPNAFGLFDMGGNVSEWIQDCWHDTYVRAPADGSAWVNPGCSQRVIRGGAWSSSPDQARSAFRLSATPDTRGSRVGFRLVREL